MYINFLNALLFASNFIVTW